MADTNTVIEQAYTAFNARDIDGAVALMTDDVSWPRASEGGKVVGKEEIRGYWTRQWTSGMRATQPLVRRRPSRIGLDARRPDPAAMVRSGRVR